MAPAPLRVTAERLSAEEAHAAQLAEAEHRRARTAVLSAAAPGPVSAPPGTVAPRPGAAIAPVAAPGLPVPLAVPPRRSGLAELLALVTGRRSTGRHRPDCVRRQAWSMFSPTRRPRRRGRFRRV